MRRWGKASLIAASLAVAPVWADHASPVGLWKNVDEASGRALSLIRITEHDGVLQGTLEKLFRAPEQEQNPKCEHCTGANKNQPVIGLVFIWGLKKEGDEYTGGAILNTDDGKVYRGKLRLLDGGRKLQVRGYIGLPMLGRSQVWLRQE